MRIVQINATCGSGSTGNICVSVSKLLTQKGVRNHILYTVGSSAYPLGTKYMSDVEIRAQALKARIFGNYGFQAQAATKRLIAELERISPDIIHLHNLHSHNVHLGMLFTWLKEKKIKVFWTFHDCWAFTGYCPHYDMIGCDQWKTGGCRECPQKRHFSCFFDRSGYLFSRKKALLTGIDLTIITPSKWLAEQVRQSFLKNCEIKVINNGIDLSVFYPRESDFREKHRLEDKFILLGVAFNWGIRKGIDVFAELAKRLDKRFKIILVGTNDKIDQLLPENILSIHCTSNQTELAEIYSAADLFVNTTREENFPTVHMEALACGTPILTFSTGGCREVLTESCGAWVSPNDVQGLHDQILQIFENRPFSAARCIEQAQNFNMDDKFEEYLALYNI